MGFADIRSQDVFGAIDLLDDPVNGPQLLERLHFKPARSYRVVVDGKFYDSKAVAGIAHGLATGEYLDGGTFTGGSRSVVSVLRRLGFYVDYQWLYTMSQLRVDRTHGRPAAYQHVVLLWAIVRSLSGLPRLAQFGDVRDELAGILAPFAIARTAPDPVMPWIALANARTNVLGEHIWELELPPDNEAVTESAVKRFNLSAGLSLKMYEYVTHEVERQRFVDATIDVLARLNGDEPGFLPLLEQLGLVNRDPHISNTSGAHEVSDAIAAVEELTHPRRRFGRRFTSAENKAIEDRAVRVTRDHFENELGYSTSDVGATESYDVHATKGSEVVKIEVKGTTTNGASVVLTRNEVKLHLSEHPSNALVVVRGIVLDHSGDEPSATGGELVVTMPWEINAAALEPIAYDYRTGL